MEIKKHLIFPMLVLAVLMSLLTVTVFAEETDTGTGQTEQGGTAETGETTQGTGETDMDTPGSETEPSDPNPDDTGKGDDLPDTYVVPETQIKTGLVKNAGSIYYYEEDGSLFVGGYKEITAKDGSIKRYYFQQDGTAFTSGYKSFVRDNTRVYCYFQKDGTAFTGGYLSFKQDGKQYAFYFQEDGTAFTGGYKEVEIDGETCYFYFLSNGQAFNTGYKTVTIDGQQYYYYFSEDGRAYTDGYCRILFGQTACYYCFGENGRAYTDGLKEVSIGSSAYRYYFFENGRALTDGWQNIDGTDFYFLPNGHIASDAVVERDGNLYYYQEDGTVGKGGWLEGSDAWYYADENGVLSTNTIIDHYKFDENGRCTLKHRIRELVSACTDDSMTDQEKINAIYTWILKNDMVYIRTNEHTHLGWVWYDGWTDDFASSILDKWGGNCYRYACLLGYMCREATGLPVYIVQGKYSYQRNPHGWVAIEQDGEMYTYDIEMNKFVSSSKAKWYKRLTTDVYDHIYWDYEAFPLF